MSKIEDSGNEWRCECGKLLFKGAVAIGVLEAKCPRCKRISYFRKLEDVASSRPVFYALLTSDGEISTVSDGVFEVLGYRPNEVVGRHIGESLSPDIRTVLQFWLKKIKRVTAINPEPLSAQVKLLHKNKSWVPVTFFARVIKDGERSSIFIVAEEGSEAIDDYFARNIKIGNSNIAKQFAYWDALIDSRMNIVAYSENNHLGLTDSDTGNSIFSYVAEQNTFTRSQLKRVISQGSNYVGEVSIVCKGKTGNYMVSVIKDVYVFPDSDKYLVSFEEISSEN